MVFGALTSLTGLAGWWSTVTGSGAAGGELRVAHGDAGSLVISVDTADRPRSFAWTVLAYSLNSEWAGTRITFLLSPDVAGLFIWARIGDQRQRSFVDGLPLADCPALTITKTSEAVCGNYPFE